VRGVNAVGQVAPAQSTTPRRMLAERDFELPTCELLGADSAWNGPAHLHSATALAVSLRTRTSLLIKRVGVPAGARGLDLQTSAAHLVHAERPRTDFRAARVSAAPAGRGRQTLRSVLRTAVLRSWLLLRLSGADRKASRATNNTATVATNFTCLTRATSLHYKLNRTDQRQCDRRTVRRWP